MPVRIRVRDFQSVEDAEVVVDRFTVVTGPNNSGKTALQRAVQGVFSNTPGDSYVRHGKERLSVEIDFGEGKVVRWEKGPKVKPTYIINGKTLHPGRAVPDEVLSFGVRPIQAGSLTVWPQIAPQFTGQVFLLDLPGSSVAEAVTDVERAGRLTQALRLAESDKRGASAELKVRRKDVEQVKVGLDAFAGLDDVAVTVAAVEETFAKAKAAGAALRVAEGFIARLRTARDEIERLVGVRLVRIPESEKLAEARTTMGHLGVARGLQARLSSSQAEIAAVAGIRSVAVPAVSPEVGTEKQKLVSLIALRAQLTAARVNVAQAQKAAEAVSGLDLSADDLVSTKVPQAKKALDYLVSLRGRLAQAMGEAASLRRTLGETVREHGEVEAEVREILGGLGECPVCGTSVTGMHPH